MNIKGTEADLGDMVAHLHEQHGTEPGLIRFILEEFFVEIPDALAEFKRIELHGFGVFRLEIRAPRHGKTPDGKEWSTPERQEIVFHASPEMRQAIEDRTGIVTY